MINNSKNKKDFHQKKEMDQMLLDQVIYINKYLQKLQC